MRLFFRSVAKLILLKDGLGVVYMADPMVDDVGATLPLELYVVTFEDAYYSSNQSSASSPSSWTFPTPADLIVDIITLGSHELLRPITSTNNIGSSLPLLDVTTR